MATTDLTTVANVQQWLGLNPGTDDQLLARMVTSISSTIQSWLNRKLVSMQFTESRDGHGGAVMYFRDYPVTSVSSVVVDSQVIPASPNGDVTQPGYTFNEIGLFLHGYRFNRGRGNVALAYTAGYTQIPSDIEQAVIETIAMRYRERDRIGQASKSIGGETVAFVVRDFPPDVMTLLQNYKQVTTL
jgi:hypothetical protein